MFRFPSALVPRPAPVRIYLQGKMLGVMTIVLAQLRAAADRQPFSLLQILAAADTERPGVADGDLDAAVRELTKTRTIDRQDASPDPARASPCRGGHHVDRDRPS
jgi:hypothetical protein